MSNIQGKNGRTTRKLQVKESSQPATGVKRTRALHQASAGDTVIDLTNLTVPTGAKNYSAPSVSDLTKNNLQQFADNVTVRTSSGVMIQNIDYVVSGATTITLCQEALDNEVFEITIEAGVRTGRTLVDGAPLISTGTLTAGTTDYNVGEPFEVGKYPGKQVGSVMVFTGGQLMYRNEGNQPDGEGDYYEVHAGAGLGTIIRFNSPLDLVEDTDIQVVSVGSLIEKPNGSQLALIEVIQGQLDAIIPTLADLAGVDETDFQATPNSVDLKAFGDRVLDLEKILDVEVFTKENNYSGSFDGSTGASVSTTDENIPGTFAVSQIATGRFTLDYSALNLTNPPALTGNCERNSSNSTSVHFDSVTNTTAEVSILSGGSFANKDFWVKLGLLGSDYNDKRTIREILGL